MLLLYKKEHNVDSSKHFVLHGRKKKKNTILDWFRTTCWDEQMPEDFIFGWYNYSWVKVLLYPHFPDVISVYFKSLACQQLENISAQSYLKIIEDTSSESGRKGSQNFTWQSGPAFPFVHSYSTWWRVIGSIIESLSLLTNESRSCYANTPGEEGLYTQTKWLVEVKCRLNSNWMNCLVH